MTEAMEINKNNKDCGIYRFTFFVLLSGIKAFCFIRRFGIVNKKLIEIFARNQWRL